MDNFFIKDNLLIDGHDKFISLFQEAQHLKIYGDNLFVTVCSGESFQLLHDDTFISHYEKTLGKDKSLKIAPLKKDDECFTSLLIVIPPSFFISKITLSVLSGNCILNNINIDELYIITQTGDINITGTVTTKMRVDTFCGNVSIKLTEDKSLYSINAQSDSGEVHIEDIVDAAILYGDGKKKIDVSSDSSDIEILF